VEKYGKVNTFNMDETGCVFSIVGCKVVAKKGSKTVFAKSLKHSYKRVTVVLCISAVGEKLTPMVIVKGESVPVGLEVDDYEVAAQKNSWMDNVRMRDWIVRVWGKSRGTKRLLIMDGFCSHDNGENVILLKFEPYDTHVFILKSQSLDATFGRRSEQIVQSVSEVVST